ncbi:DoxX family protein [Chitinophaga oryzae]|uniref:DoxX family protein n=1 Tax=Chitinophaga oryzae TaxID=2725414 RepID=A0AAE6ZD37_9BACT|nr:DoxX family protein [Chitinophaga oryzae]QJB30668.1 DoxX family protein [Chitinophaga oryzae]QJB37169.1 DoxX family protein [Chitinophaga oryzae]
MKTKTATIIYWSATIFMSLWFGASGFFELTKNPIVWGITQQLGYPPHFIYILGVFKIAGVITLLIPHKFLRLKEWVFAGMFFDITFAFFSKISVLGFPATVDAIIAFTVLSAAYVMFRKLYPANYATLAPAPLS